MHEVDKRTAKPKPWLTVERLQAFSDGVIAIVITILVLEIKVPESHDFNAEGVISLLLKISPDVLVYFVSFALIGTFWLQHHVLFHYIVRTDRPLVFLNLLFLFSLSLSPFLTELLGAYRGVRPVETLFGINFFMSGVMLGAMWYYAVLKGHFLCKPLHAAVVRSMRRRILVAPVLCLLGIIAATFDFRVANVLFLCIPFFYLSHWLVDTSWQRPD